MSDSDELTKARDDVLRKIGRNVLNLQKMEAMLKLLVANARFQVKASDLSAARRRVKTVSRQSMGRLAESFVDAVYSGKPENDFPVEELTEVSVSFSFRIESDKAFQKERRKALSSVVAERNRLIHQMLGALDVNSAASCVELASELDQQHAKIWPEFQTLKSLVTALREHQADLMRYVGSDEFTADMARASKEDEQGQ